MRKTSDELTSRLIIAVERVSEFRVSQYKPPKLESKQNKNFTKNKQKKEQNIQVMWNKNKRYIICMM